MRCLFSALLALAALPISSFGQATPAASRVGDLQIGVGFTSANADYEYVPDRLRGFDLYSDFDFRNHLGVEVNFHQLDDPMSAVYQRTYEAGVRYLRHYGALTPYTKGMYGRGVLNFPDNAANLGYNMLSAGAGLDFAVREYLNLRADFEYQYWLSAPGGGLHIAPTLFTIGAAYHFPAGRPH